MLLSGGAICSGVHGSSSVISNRVPIRFNSRKSAVNPAPHLCNAVQAGGDRLSERFSSCCGVHRQINEVQSSVVCYIFSCTSSDHVQDTTHQEKNLFYLRRISNLYWWITFDKQRYGRNRSAKQSGRSVVDRASTATTCCSAAEKMAVHVFQTCTSDNSWRASNGTSLMLYYW